MLAIIGLQHHKPLIAVICLFDMGYSCLHRLFQAALVFLYVVCTPIQRQQKKIHDQAHYNDRDAGIVNIDHCIPVYNLKQDFKRLYE